MKPKRYRIICPKCKGESLENTDKLGQDITINGAMFSQIEGMKVRQTHIQKTFIRGQNFGCPLCMMPLCSAMGNVMIRNTETGQIIMSNQKMDLSDEVIELPEPIPPRQSLSLNQRSQLRRRESQRSPRK